MNHDITSEAEAMKKPVDGERIMERRAVKLHFDDEDMGFNLMWVLGQSHWRSVMYRAWRGLIVVALGSGDVAWLVLRCGAGFRAG
jgi:hypothetical protein